MCGEWGVRERGNKDEKGEVQWIREDNNTI